MVKKTLPVLLALVLVLGGVAAACSPKPAASPAPVMSKKVVIAPGPVGVGGYTIAVIMSSLLQKNTDLEAYVLASAQGSIAALVASGKADVGTQGVVEIYRAFNAVDDPLYIGKPPLTNLRVLNGGTLLPFAMFVRGDSGIRKVADLKGKRVPTDVADNWSTAFYTINILKSAGLDPVKDIVPVSVSSIADGWEQLLSSKVDAFMTTIRGPRMLELESKVKGYALDMGEPAAKKMGQLVPGFVPISFKKGVAAVRDADIWVTGFQGTYFTSTNLPDEIAYAYVKAVVEHSSEFTKENAEMADWGKANAVIEATPVPYHTGAIKYYKEIGIWTDTAEKQQKALLSQIKATK